MRTEKIDLSSSWDDLWNAVSAGVGPGLTRLLAVVGVALVAFAILKWAWDKRKGGGGMGRGGGGVGGALIIGALLSAPDVLMPIALKLADGVINAVVQIWNNTNGG